MAVNFYRVFQHLFSRWWLMRNFATIQLFCAQCETWAKLCPSLRGCIATNWLFVLIGFWHWLWVGLERQRPEWRSNRLIIEALASSLGSDARECHAVTDIPFSSLTSTLSTRSLNLLQASESNLTSRNSTKSFPIVSSPGSKLFHSIPPDSVEHPSIATYSLSCNCSKYYSLSTSAWANSSHCRYALETFSLLSSPAFCSPALICSNSPQNSGPSFTAVAAAIVVSDSTFFD